MTGAVAPNADQTLALSKQVLDFVGELSPLDLSPTLRAIARPVLERALAKVLSAPNAQAAVAAIQKARDAWPVVKALLED